VRWRVGRRAEHAFWEGRFTGIFYLRVLIGEDWCKCGVG
jgi:hypothetical protein